MRPLIGKRAMLYLLELELGSRVPAHDHPQEQLGYVFEGELVLEIASVAHTLRAGSACQIPAGNEHAAWSESRCLVLEVFHPGREKNRERAGSGA